MSCFTTMTAVTAGVNTDLTKHVNYTAGMILGVDDFTQEFAYLSGRNRWLARDAIGYGTISDLSIRVEKDGEKGWRVMVAPGVAITPRGQMICVSSAQCAYLNQWLAAADVKQLNEKIKTIVTSPPANPPVDNSELSLYVVLCYRDCPTDNVPIPGEPCRDENELSAASRIKDDFSLELRFEAPKQAEEDAVVKFVKRLKEIEVIETGTATDLTDFLQALRDEFIPTSPPNASPAVVLQILKDDVCEYMQAAFRLWVTELRTVLSERKTGCSIEMTGGGKLEDCVLLAEVKIPLTVVSPGWEVSDTQNPLIIEDNRPFLLHLRMLQEWLLCGFTYQTGTGIPVVSPPVTSPPDLPAHTHTLGNLNDVSLPATLEDGQVLILRNGKWSAEIPVTTDGGITDHGALNGLNDDDHEIYLLADGSRPLGGPLDAGGNQISNLGAATADGEAVIFQQAIKQNDNAGGDLNGKYPTPKVIRLQGNAVSNLSPENGDILVWNTRSSTWTPQQPAQSSVKPFLILPLAKVTRREIPSTTNINAVLYEIWMNIDAPGNLAEIPKLNNEVLTIFSETESETGTPQPFLSAVDFDVRRLRRNVFQLQLKLLPRQAEPNFMRFMFNVNEKIVSVRGDEVSLLQYAEKSNIRFSGFMEGKFATVFVRGADGKIG